MRVVLKQECRDCHIPPSMSSSSDCWTGATHSHQGSQSQSRIPHVVPRGIDDFHGLRIHLVQPLTGLLVAVFGEFATTNQHGSDADRLLALRKNRGQPIACPERAHRWTWLGPHPRPAAVPCRRTRPSWATARPLVLRPGELSSDSVPRWAVCMGFTRVCRVFNSIFPAHSSPNFLSSRFPRDLETRSEGVIAMHHWHPSAGKQRAGSPRDITATGQRQNGPLCP